MPVDITATFDKGSRGRSRKTLRSHRTAEQPIVSLRSRLGRLLGALSSKLAGRKEAVGVTVEAGEVGGSVEKLAPRDLTILIAVHPLEPNRSTLRPDGGRPPQPLPRGRNCGNRAAKPQCELYVGCVFVAGHLGI